MVYRSLKDWNKRGKKVIKGERASARSASGVSLFSGSQVEKFEKPHRREAYREYPDTSHNNNSSRHCGWDHPDDGFDIFDGCMVGIGWGSN